MNTLLKHQTDLARLLKFLAAVRAEFGEHVSVQQIQAFLCAATSPDGIGQGDLANRTGIGRPSLSRIVAQLAGAQSARTPGPGLLDQTVDPVNRLYRIVSLTAEGKAVAARILTKTYGTKS